MTPSRAPEHHPFLPAEDCPPIAQAVHDAARFWTRRHPTAPSFTLGAACYLDVPEHGIEEYYRRAVRGNVLLQRRFRPLYAQLLTRIVAILGAPAVYSNRYALPGFHVFVASPEIRALEPKVHFDLQDLDLEWEDGGARRPDERISFTLPVQLPKCGGGLWVWDIEHEDVRDQATIDVAALATHERTLVQYQVGELVVHSGDRLHQIENARQAEPGEVRMTLQGHARKTRGTWILYW